MFTHGNPLGGAVAMPLAGTAWFPFSILGSPPLYVYMSDGGVGGVPHAREASPLSGFPSELVRTA